MAAMQGNAGAGGVFMALAADHVLARAGVVLSPHYKNMGNLYGSEYWTYLLPRRVGDARAREIMENRLPIGAGTAKRLGLIDDCFGDDRMTFAPAPWSLPSGLRRARTIRDCSTPRTRAARDEAAKPLAAYREEELARMRLNFYGFDPSYHVARYHFVHRVPHAWTPLHLARHRGDLRRPATIGPANAAAAKRSLATPEGG